MVFLSLIVRYFNEPFLDEFVEYYFSEGVDSIYILYDVQSTIPISEKVKNSPNVFISDSINIRSNSPDRLWKDTNILYTKIRNTSEWFMYIDCDEFINTRKNDKSTIRHELKTTFKNADCVKIPWIMMSCDKRQCDPPSILQYLTRRWDHDKRHPHPNNWKKGKCTYKSINVKCIFKGKTFDYITDHYPHSPSDNQHFVCVDSVDNIASPLNHCYKNLRENKIKNAYMVCHHYRIFSKKSCKRKFRNNGFSGYVDNFKNLWMCDYNEMSDNTLQQKSIRKFGLKK